MRVVRDTGPRLWVTSRAAGAPPGAVVASLDDNSAKHSANMLGLVLMLD